MAAWWVCQDSLQGDQMMRRKSNMYERHTGRKQRAVRDKKKGATSIVDGGVRQTRVPVYGPLASVLLTHLTVFQSDSPSNLSWLQGFGYVLKPRPLREFQMAAIDIAVTHSILNRGLAVHSLCPSPIERI